MAKNRKVEDDPQKRPTSGFGSIEKRGNAYRAVYRVGGRKHYGPMPYPTWELADNYLTIVRGDLIRGTWTDVKPAAILPTLSDFGDRVIRQRKGIKESTRAQYALDFRLHVKPYLGRFHLDDITPDLVRQWNAELAEDLKEKLAQQSRTSTATRRDGAATVARAYRTLRLILRLAVDDELITRNPCRIEGADKAPTPERATLDPKEVDLLAETVPEHYRGLVLLAAYGALRIGELAALRIRDLDLGPRASVSVVERVYRVSGYDFDTPKSAAGTRVVAIDPALRDALKRHLRDHRRGAGSDDLVFVSRNGGNVLATYSQVVRRALVKVGRPDVVFHGTRHTGALLAVEAGATLPELMQRLGHSTMDAAAVYLHVGEEHGRAVADEIGRRAAAARADSGVVQLSTARRRRRSASA